MKKLVILILFCAFLLVIKSCKKDVEVAPYIPTPYELKIPVGFPEMIIPEDNPLTVEGIALGRKLFYEEKLSGDNSMACADCHMQQYGFGDPDQFSQGIDGSFGNRQAMALINLGWEKFYFWDGRAATLEEQIFGPVMNPIEMNESWANAMDELREDPIYREMFRKAFGTAGVDSVRASKAIAQFLRTVISGNSKFDKVNRGEVSFTPSESSGYDLFMRDKDEANLIAGGDCFHCHGPILMSKQFYSNNGLDAVFTDSGRGAVTGNPLEVGKFKIPTLRNIELTGPYMHDGRFTTLDQVVNHYSSGLVVSPTIDPLMKFAADGGLALSPQEKADIKAFLLTLTDYDFINNPDFSDPDQ